MNLVISILSDQFDVAKIASHQIVFDLQLCEESVLVGRSLKCCMNLVVHRLQVSDHLECAIENLQFLSCAPER